MVKDVDDFDPDTSGDDYELDEANIRKKMIQVQTKNALNVTVRVGDKENMLYTKGTTRIEGRLAKFWKVEHDSELLDLWSTRRLIKRCNFDIGAFDEENKIQR